MAEPLVSVIIPNYNYSRYIREAIDSVLAQTHSQIEIIVVDDGSTDDSRNVIESYGSRVRPVFQQNSGVSAARNRGAKVSAGRFLAFLDADDVWLPEKAAKQLEAFGRGDDIGLVHVGLTEIDAAGNLGKTVLEGMEGDVVDEMLLFERPVILGGGSGYMVRRELFDAVGGFDEQLSTSADWDLAFQVACRSKVGFVPEPLLLYRVHGSNMHSNIGVMEHDVKIAWAKARSSLGADKARDWRLIYANLYRVLAGSYFRNGGYTGFLRNLAKSVCLRPVFLAYYLRLMFGRPRQR